MTNSPSAASPLSDNPGFASALVSLEDHQGFLFRSDDLISLCFVPEDCVSLAGDGNISIDEVRYFNSGWSVRNMRVGDSDSGGSYLFPQAEHLVRDLAEPAVKKFLLRISGHPA